jgi:hypothetical protein
VHLPCTFLTKRAIKALVQLPHTLPKRAIKALVQAKRAFKALALQISPPQASSQRRVPRVAKITGEIFLMKTLPKKTQKVLTKMTGSPLMRTKTRMKLRQKLLKQEKGGATPL